MRRRRRSSPGTLLWSCVLLGALWGAFLYLNPAAAEVLLSELETHPGALHDARVRALIRLEEPAAVGWPESGHRQSPRPEGPRSFRIALGEPPASIARRAAEAGFVTRPIDLLLPLYERGTEDRLQAGTYLLAPQLPSALALTLQRAPSSAVTLQVIEGWRLSQIAAAVAERFPHISAEAFLAAARVDGQSDPVLQGLERGTPLEGLLFPESYFFDPEATAPQIVRTMLDTFNERAGALVVRAASPHKVRPIDIVTMASLVERETSVPDERATVASVYWNRLRRAMKLQADPTVQYALGDWREPTVNDLALPGPYNTYVVNGLPPTPIAAPGLAALKAAAIPADTSFYFFVARGDGLGGHVFATTAEEHARNVERYLHTRAAGIGAAEATVQAPVLR